MSAIDTIKVAIATTALTAYAHIGLDAIKVTMVTLNGSPWFRRWDTGEILATLPLEFRTVTDVSAMLATTGKRHNLASLRWSSIPAHTYKESLDLSTLLARRGEDQHLEALIANYNALNSIAA